MIEAIDVAIIGSGPAGLAAALELRRRGVQDVVVLERESEPGGVPRHCAHPPYGFREFGRIMRGPAYARRLVALARQAGVQIRTLHTVVQLLPDGGLDVMTPEGRQLLWPRRVVIATGIRETPRSARLISGDRPSGVINTGALQASVHLHGLLPFKRPVIIGTELVSLSAVATCRSHGIKPVAIIENGERPTARWPLTLFPRLLGIPVHLNTVLTAIRGEARVDSVVVSGPDGERDIGCDGVLLTGQFVPEAALVRASHLALDPASEGPSIDQFGRCSDPAFFAAGNILRGVETSGWCFREGRRIAGILADDLAGHLPAPRREILLRCGPDIKLVVPQRLATPGLGNSVQPLQLRVTRAVSGTMRLRAGSRVLWERPIWALPERRILVPLAGLEGVTVAKEFVVEIIP